MAANDTLGLNQVFQIYHEDGSEYDGLVMHKSATDSVVMSLGDSITGDVYWRDNELALTMKEYITYNGVNYVLVNPPTIVREGMVADNSELKGMTKYSFKFYHPMYQLGNFPFSDVAVTNDQKKYLSENKTFSWIGTANDFLAKLNKNLEDTQWKVEMSNRFPEAKKTEMSDVIAFDKNTVADALKVAYDTWGVPYVIDVITSGQAGYSSGKRFKVVWGLPSNEIYENASKKQQNIPYVFQMGKGVGLKNNSRTPRNNKIITRIAGYGSEDNIPYGYPQIQWYGNQSWDYTINNASGMQTITVGGRTIQAMSYPIYDGIVGGQKVRLIKHPFTRTHLMPNVYVDAVNKKVNPNATGYDPDTELKDYYDATEADDYPNPINLQAPSYDIHEFEDIKPELGNETIVGVTPLNPDLTPASGWDDTMDDDGNYLQSYFEITLPTLSFDIYACAAITEAMQINMRSGACLGCTFPVEVDWEDYKANFYNEDGEFDPVIHTQENDGHVRNGKKYPNSTTTSVKLILKKEIETFGTLMPNTYQHPSTGDQFVVLGISLPTSYITNAQTRLDNAMKSYMLENNVYYYDYPLKFDEAFLRENTYVLQQIKPNSIIRFKFAGETLQLFVKQMNVKFGEGVLPKYDITLTDNVDVVLNQIGQVADDVEKLATLISLLRQSYSNNVWVELAKKLSKTDDDTAQGFIRFVKGLQVGERFDSGLLGEGGVFRKDADGTTYIEADKLYIRMRAYFDSVEIRKYMHSGGNRVATPAGAKCVRVENIARYQNHDVVVDDDGTYWEEDINGDKHAVAYNLDIVRYRCYFRGEDSDGNKVTNDFVIGDQAYCHITNGGTASLQMHHYWRLITATNTENDNGRLTEDGEFWIELANYNDQYGQPVNITVYKPEGGSFQHMSHQAGSDVPAAQDDIVQLGHAFDTGRQGAIIEYSSGEDSPSYKIYQNIDDFSFEDTNYISLGYDSQTGRAYMNVYGDFFFGAKEDPVTGESPTYIKYDAENQELQIKAAVEFIHPDGQGGTTSTPLGDFASAVESSIEDLQSQIDGEIDTWFYEGTPTLNNLPASGWTTEEEKERHIGDLYYDIGSGQTAGFAYRFVRSSAQPYVYSWQYIDDTAITEALRIAAQAQDTADHKRRVFLSQPVPPYDEGDLWVNATYPANYTGETDEAQHKYKNEILKCIKKVPRTEQGQEITTFSINDWSLANGYSAALKDFITGDYSTFVTNIQGQVDQKAETWYQDTDPSSAWNTSEKKEAHVGDIWYDTSNNGGHKTYIWQDFGSSVNPRYAWAEANVPDDVFDKIDGKCAIYVNNPTTASNQYPTNYHAKDMWILPIDGVHNTYTIGSNTYKAGEILFALVDSTNFNAAHWEKKLRYTGDERIDGFINQILNGSGASGNDATVANAISAVTGALNEDTTVIDGGLVLTSLIGLRSNSRVWAGISGLYKTAETGDGYKGHGIAAWYGGGYADWEVYFDSLTPAQQQSSTISDAYAKSLFRFDGSGYLAGGNITWDKNGIVTIANVYANISGTDTSLTGTLQTLTNLSNALPLTLRSGVTYLDPQYGFTQLSISHANDYTITANSVLNYGEMKERFVPLEFFNALFTVYANDAATTVINPWTWTDTAVASRTAINNLKIMVGAWTNQYLSALGLNSSGGGGSGVQLAEPLSAINAAGMGAPNTTGQAIVWNGSAWVYSIYTTLRASGLYSAGTIASYGNFTSTQGDFIAASGHGFKVSDKDDTYVLLAGGGTKALSEIGSAYTLPSATTSALGGIMVGATLNTNPSINTSTGSAARNYAVLLRADGVAFVQVPWENTDTDTKNTTGTGITQASGNCYIVCATSQDSNGVQTYTQSNAYIKNGYLYSGGSKVLTTGTYTLDDVADGTTRKLSDYTKTANLGSMAFADTGDYALAVDTVFKVKVGTTEYTPSSGTVSLPAYITSVTSAMVTGALGYTPVAPSTLDNYLAKSGGTMTGSPFIKMPASAASIGDDYPFGITYGRIQAYGNLIIAADTDGSQTEYVILTAGHGVSSATAANGLAVGYNALTWKNNTIWHAGNDGSGSGLDADTLDGNHASAFVVSSTLNNYLPLSGGKLTGNLGIGRDADGYQLDVIGQLRLKNNTSHTSLFSMGCFTDTNNPYIRLRDTNGTDYDIKVTSVTSGSSTVNVFQLGNHYAQTRILGSNVRIYARTDSSATTYTPAIITMYGGRVFVGSDTSVASAYTDYRLVVDGGLVSHSNSYLNGNVGIGVAPSSSYALKTSGHIYLASGTNDQIVVGATTYQQGGWRLSVVNSSGSGSFYAAGGSRIDRLAINATPNDSYRLYVDGNTYEKGRIYFYVSSSATINIESYTNPAGNYFNVNATGICVNGSTISSDMRKKNIISNVDFDIQKIADAPIFNFTWKDKANGYGIHVGTSAQYWQSILQNTVIDMGELGLTLDYNAISVASVVLTARKVVDHEKRIRLLEVENEALRKEIDQLKNAA